VQLELLRREADVRFDEIGVEADAARGRIDAPALFSIARASLCKKSTPISLSTLSAA
jgi:hypothetical protein